MQLRAPQRLPADVGRATDSMYNSSLIATRVAVRKDTLIGHCNCSIAMTMMNSLDKCKLLDN